MLRVAVVSLSSLAFAAWTMSTSAQEDEARTLLARAVETHGGKERLQKYQVKTIEYKAEFFTGYETEGQLSIQFGDRMKHLTTLLHVNIKAQVVFDGKDLWTSSMGITQRDINNDEISAVENALYVDAVHRLADLNDKGYKLAALGERKIKGDHALGIRVSKDGKPDVDLWFDKSSNLLLKSAFDGYHPLTLQLASSRKTKHELYFGNYKSVMGVQTPQRIEILNQVAKMRIDVSRTRYFERAAANLFAKP